MIPVAAALEECKEITSSIDIPCRVTTTWVPPNNCNTYTVTIFNDSGVNLSTMNLSAFGNTGYCTFNFTYNSSGSYPYNISNGDSGNVLVENSRMWLASVLLIPLGLAFLFLYWGATLNEEQEPMKWFMRLLSLVMIFILFAAANIVINLNPGFEALQDIFNITWITWIFWSMFALFVVYFIYRIALAMRQKADDDFKNGILK